MRLKMTGLAIVASMIAYLGMTGISLAASSPTASATGASAVTNTSATINATIDANGAATNYYFSYGPTSALGTNSTTETVAAAAKGKTVSDTVSQLESGTTYYYELTAENAAGSSTTKIVTFTTKGPVPATATTGGATVDSASSATVTGVVNTQNTNTSYYFRYGTSPALGYQTSVVGATPSTTPSAVAYTLAGLTPGTTFYYQLVAVNGPGNTSAGTIGSLVTYPDPIDVPKVAQYTTPKNPIRGPYVFTTNGKIINTSPAPDSVACTGTATVAFYYKTRLIYRQLAALTPTCTFSAKTTFRSLPLRGYKTNSLLVYVRYDGNGYLKYVALRPQPVKLG